MLSVALLCVCAVAFGRVSGRSDSGNFLDDKWLTGRWDKFRDEPGTWTPSKSFDQGKENRVIRSQQRDVKLLDLSDQLILNLTDRDVNETIALGRALGDEAG
ncbi:hypothetical protein fugu_008393 [Takifugu bimaculatus]|uniref:Uncharacterized protein n=1 Tax=Takifugu bimaculatus TaxID=433685 RepID=A0A4Z2B193_9TELE|nr:hypothetical protein fugu_008393 [Takifugu bimaculatus]